MRVSLRIGPGGTNDTVRLKPDFHLKIISREILDSSNLIGFAQFSEKKVENISTFFNFVRNTTIENGPIFEFRINFFKWKSGFREVSALEDARFREVSLYVKK